MVISGSGKKALIGLGSILLFVVIIIAFLSPIAKYLLEKYDTKLIGRQITVRGAYVNPFTGFVRFSGIRIFEENSDSVFIAAKSLSGNFELLKLLFKTYEIDHLHLEEPRINVIQNKDSLNFRDIIEFYTPKQPRKKRKEPLHLNLLDMKIIRGEFRYKEKSIPVSYSLRQFNASSKGLMWDVDSIAVKFDFLSGSSSGSIDGNISVDKNNADYKLAAIVNKYDLHFLEQYLKDLSNFGSFRANMDADFRATGNFKVTQNINTTGLFTINDLHVGKNKNEDYVAFKKFAVNIEQLDPEHKKYLFDSISLVEPFCKFELYDYLNNIEMMFGKGGKKAIDHSRFNIIVEIGKYIEQLSRNFLKSDYKINRLALYNGKFKYEDYKLSELFAVSADPVFLLADSIRRDNKPVEFSFKAGIKPYGDASVFLSINPKDSSDFDVSYSFQQIPVTLFNPYLIKYTSFPLDRGTLELEGNWRVRNGYINATNRLTIIDPRIYRRVRNVENRWVPLRLIAYFVRERGNVIDYEIPISGNLRDPKFRFKDVIFDIAENIIVKPVSSPYIVKVKLVENKIEKSRVLRWEMHQNTLSSDQDKFLRKLSDFLLENSTVVLNINQSVYSEKEKEHILLYEAKKRYYLVKQDKNESHLTEQDIAEIENLSIKDSLFIRFLNSNTKHTLLFTVQDKCLALIGKKQVELKFKQLLEERKKVFMNYFEEKHISARIRINPVEEKIPYNGFSSYRIDYKGDLPPDLEKAINQMNELNNKSPRKKFKTNRDIRRSLIRAKNRK